jgi:hypothetical protein
MGNEESKRYVLCCSFLDYNIHVAIKAYILCMLVNHKSIVFLEYHFVRLPTYTIQCAP